MQITIIKSHLTPDTPDTPGFQLRKFYDILVWWLYLILCRNCLCYFYFKFMIVCKLLKLVCKVIRYDWLNQLNMFNEHCSSIFSKSRTRNYNSNLPWRLGGWKLLTRQSSLSVCQCPLICWSDLRPEMATTASSRYSNYLTAGVRLGRARTRETRDQHYQPRYQSSLSPPSNGHFFRQFGNINCIFMRSPRPPLSSDHSALKYCSHLQPEEQLYGCVSFPCPLTNIKSEDQAEILWYHLWQNSHQVHRF